VTHGLLRRLPRFQELAEQAIHRLEEFKPQASFPSAMGDGVPITHPGQRTMVLEN